MSHPHIVRYQTSWVETETQSVDARQRLGALKDSTPGIGKNDDKSDDGSDEDGEVDSDVAAALDLEALDFDLDEELDFLSGPHPSKNISYPSIHFGDADDSVSRAPTSKPVSHGGTDVSHETSESESHSVRTLYIQMEYIPGFTLREVRLTCCYTIASEVNPVVFRLSTRVFRRRRGMRAFRFGLPVSSSLTDPPSWRLLRQMLSAMLHFTSIK
jgi:hypothetical protein